MSTAFLVQQHLLGKPAPEPGTRGHAVLGGYNPPFTIESQLYQDNRCRLLRAVYEDGSVLQYTWDENGGHTIQEVHD